MRISDCISYVCSSDLRGKAPADPRLHHRLESLALLDPPAHDRRVAEDHPPKGARRRSLGVVLVAHPPAVRLDRAVLGDRAEAFGQFRLPEVIAQPRQYRPADFEPDAVRPGIVVFPTLGIEAINPPKAIRPKEHVVG